MQAIFFDMGGTVETYWYDHNFRLQATGELQQLLREAGIEFDSLNNAQLYQLITQGLDRYKKWSLQTHVELPPERIWREYILVDYPVDSAKVDRIADGLAGWIETKYYWREMRPEIPAVLERIRDMGLKMGIISNVQSRSQVPQTLDKYGIRHFFNPIVLSSVFGYRKPHPAIFLHAARLADVPPEDCVHVGDRISRDILGARRAGFRLAIQIRHPFEDDNGDFGVTPDVVLENMAELVAVLEQELRKSA